MKLNELDTFLNDKSKTFKDMQIIEFAPPEECAQIIAEQLAKKKMKITQLRKIFTTIKALELRVKDQKPDDSFMEQEFYMLIPHLAYAKGRDLIPSDFYDRMKKIIGDGKTGKIKTVEDFKRFVDFMTAIIAYHKEISSSKGGNKHD
jgi:CRISPR-associated protein Csm2